MDGYNAPSPLGVVNIQGTLVAGDNLVAHRQSNAGPPRLGGPLIELVLHVGQLLSRDTGAVVPDGDNHLVLVPGDSGINALARAAVLGGVVQQVAEHLPQPLRVPRDGRKLLVAVEVVEFNALPPEELPVGIDRILQFRLDVHGLH